jgi:hypothetical protein
MPAGVFGLNPCDGTIAKFQQAKVSLKVANGVLQGTWQVYFVELLHALDVDRVDQRPALGERLRVKDPRDREHHVVGGEFLAVVEGDALAHPDRPLGGVGVRRDLPGQLKLGQAVRVDVGQLLVDGRDPDPVRRVVRVVRVHRVRGGTAGDGYLQRAAVLGLAGAAPAAGLSAR